MGLSNRPGSVESGEIQKFEIKFKALFTTYQPYYPRTNDKEACLRDAYDGGNEFRAMVAHAATFFRSHLKNRSDADQLEAMIANVLSEFHASSRNSLDMMTDELFRAELMKEIYKGIAIGRQEEDETLQGRGEVNAAIGTQGKKISGLEYLKGDALLAASKREPWE